MDKYEYKNRYKYLSNVMLNVTDDCNLQCRYCFVEQQPHYMTLDTAKATVDWIVLNRKKKILLGYPYDKKSLLYFFGGEPMLCYKSIIVPLIKYCKEKYPNQFSFGMTTNGTLLDKESIDFLYENNFDLLLSIDGDKETQDFNRPCRNCQLSSFDLIEKNIKYLLEKFPNLVFRSTIYAPTAKNLFNNYLYAESLGFKSFTMVADVRHPWNNEQINDLRNEMTKMYQYLLTKIINKEPINTDITRIRKWLKHTVKINDDRDEYNILKHNSVLRCGMATTVGAVGWDGSIYGCQEQVSKEQKSIFYIGNIFNGGIDIEKHNNLLKQYYNTKMTQKIQKNECKSCILKDFCVSGIWDCPSASTDIFNDMNTNAEISCQIKKIYFNNSLLLMKIIFSLKDTDIHNHLLQLIRY